MALRIDHSRVGDFIRRMNNLGYIKVSSELKGTKTCMVFRNQSGQSFYISITENGWVSFSPVSEDSI